MFTQVEKDRLSEIVLYLYFNNKDSEDLAKSEFWDAILNICKVYTISGIAVSRAARILFSDEHKPSDFEMWYLLNKLGLSVRPIRKITGIYWQKQKHYEETVEKYGPPTIKRAITDASMKQSIKDFITALYKMFGVFTSIDEKYLTDLFNL